MGDWNVKIKDFQSLKNVDIKIPPGITIITGPSNNGKTAILRAIDTALFNNGSDDMVRSGKSVSGVTISNGEHTVIYCRTSKGKSEKTAYQFDGGAVQRKVGRGQLPEVQKMFGVSEVKMQNNVKVKLNFWYQNDRPFLMDKTAGQLYEFLSLSSADRYFKILKSLAVDLKVQEAEINNSNTVIDTLKSVNNSKQDFIDKNKGFDKVYEQAIIAGREADKLNKCLSIIEAIEKLQEQIDQAEASLKIADDKMSAIPMESISTTFNMFLETEKNYTNLMRIASDVARLRNAVISNTDSVNKITEKFSSYDSNLKAVEPDIEKLLDLSGKIAKIGSIQSSCEKFSESIKSISQRIEDMKIKDVDLNSLDNSLKSLISLGGECEKISGLVSSVSSISDRVQNGIGVVQGISSKIESLDGELENLKSEVGYCPFCGSVFCSH